MHANLATRLRGALAALLATTGLLGIGPVALEAEKTPPADLRYVYGPDPLEYAEVRLPPGRGPFPVAIVIHGGCWQAALDGLPPEVLTLALTRPLAAALTRDGFATVNVEYRRLGDAGGGWPGTYRDVARAADGLRAIARARGLDLARTIVVGHSAGGQLAEWLAARPKLAAASDLYAARPLRIAGVVDVDGPPGIGLGPDVTERFCGTETLARLAGGTHAEVPLRYRDGSADALLPLGVPQDIFVSSSFGPAWPPVFAAYHAAANAAGDSVRVERLTAENHFDLIDPLAPSYPRILAAARKLAAR